jgi:hypothetical protein
MKEVNGPRRHFSKAQFNPYFHTHYYRNESEAGKVEKKVIESFLKIFKFKKPNS